MKTILLSLLACLIWPAQAFAQLSVDDYNRAITHLENARKHLNTDAYASAIEELETTIAIDSTQRDAYLLLYTACYYADRPSLCISYLTKAKNIFLEDDEICFFLGKTYQNMKQYNEAMPFYNEAIAYSKINGEDFPLVPDYYANRGVCYLRKDQYQQALNDFDAALKFNDLRKDVYTNRGFALYKLKKLPEACASWKKAVELGEDSAKQYLEKNCK